jgi:hypothetical protein
MNAVNAVWTNDYQGSGVRGLVCTDKCDQSKVLFFPAASCAINGRIGIDSVGCYGYYWSSSLYSDNVNHSYRLYFNSDYVYWHATNSRCYGYQVRGVLGEIS